MTKVGAEQSTLDAVVVCRRRDSALPVPPGAAGQAAELAEERLTRLRSSGVEFGPGDVRSVIRGHVLAVHTRAPDRVDLDELAAMADKYASDGVRRFLRPDEEPV